MEDLFPTEFYLSQNHPNPFSEKTVIKYCVPEESRIKLEIFDSRQEKIKTLVDEIKEPGTYQIKFYNSKLEEDEYTYALQADSFFEKKKMLLRK